MGNGVEAWRQEIVAAKTEVKDDLRHESAARDSVLQSFLNSALETLRRMETENEKVLSEFKSEIKEAQAKRDTEMERLEKRLMKMIATGVAAIAAILVIFEFALREGRPVPMIIQLPVPAASLQAPAVVQYPVVGVGDAVAAEVAAEKEGP